MLSVKCATKDELNNIINLTSNLKSGTETGYYTLVECDEERSTFYGSVSVNIKFKPVVNKSRPFEVYVDTEGFFEKSSFIFDFYTAKDTTELYDYLLNCIMHNALITVWECLQ